MMMKRWMIAIALGLTVGCVSAGMERVQTYPLDQWTPRLMAYDRAHVPELAVGNKVFSMWFHPAEPTLLIARRSLAGPGVALAEGYGFASSTVDGPEPQWRRGANYILNPLGCEVTDIYPLHSPYWEAVYRCEDGATVSAAVIEQNRAAWQGRREIAYP